MPGHPPYDGKADQRADRRGPPLSGRPPLARPVAPNKREVREPAIVRNSIGQHPLRRVLDCAREGGHPSASDLRLVNEWARGPVAAPQIGPDFTRTSVGPDPVTGALAHIARKSAEFVTGSELARVHSCAGCTLLFIDHSRPGTRRWCSMERCGNRDKTARYRQKRRT